MPSFPIAVGWDPTKNGTSKRPLTPHGHHDASTNPERVRDLFVQYGDNLRPGEELAAGMQPAGYLVADCDRHGHGDGPAYANSIGLNGTWAVDTASGGEHRYYRKPAGATYSNHIPEAWRGLIDVRADQGWVVCPGCTTSWGSWTPRTPWDQTLVTDLPPHIINLLRPANPTGGGARRQYQPERDNPRLDSATIETHTILINHYGIDPQRTTTREAADRNTGELRTVLDVVRPGKTFGTSGTIGFISPGGLWVFTDAWPQLPANRGYSANELLMKARGPWQPTPPPDDADDPGNPFGYIDWDTLWSSDTEDREELIPGLWTVGACGSIYSPAGAGKSLLGLEWAACMALGHDILGQPIAPRTVLYLDLENDEQLIRERLEELGHANTNIEHLHYSLLGDWQPLDTEPGGTMLLTEATRLAADIVIIDTTSRIINGEENTADTFLNLYRHTMRPLKAAGIATLRFDHSGKDLTKGERGSSAKRSDVDLTYRLTLTGDNTVTLKREKNRLHLPGPDTLTLTREEDPLRHTPLPADQATQAKVADLIALLDQLDAPNDTGRIKARHLLKQHGHKARSNHLAEAVQRRKSRPQTVWNRGDRSGTGSEDLPQDLPQTCPQPVPNLSPGEGDLSHNPATPKGGGVGQVPPPACDTCGNPLYLVKPGRTRCARCDKEATP